MDPLKNIAKSILSAYDDVLYFFWRIANPPKRQPNIQKNNPLISLIVPVYNTDHDFLRTMIKSVIGQRYDNWELVLIDDASPDKGVREIIKEYADNDTRITYTFLTENHQIAGATNVGFKVAKGEYIGLLDHDDIIYPTTLQEVVRAINAYPDAQFIYTDEDKVIGSKRTQPFFKPSWNLNLLHCVNYITHFAVFKKEALEKIGYEDGDYNGAQDWELFLRAGRHIPANQIVHIPQILYGWRVHALSTSTTLDVKPYVLESQIKAVQEDLRLRGDNSSVERDKRYPGQLSINDNKAVRGLKFNDLRIMLGIKRMIFIMLSSRLSLSRHIYRTNTYDKIV